MDTLNWKCIDVLPLHFTELFFIFSISLHAENNFNLLRLEDMKEKTHSCIFYMSYDLSFHKYDPITRGAASLLFAAGSTSFDASFSHEMSMLLEGMLEYSVKLKQIDMNRIRECLDEINETIPSGDESSSLSSECTVTTYDGASE